MIDTIRRFLNMIGPERERTALDALFTAVSDALLSQSLMSAGLVIKGVGNTLAKTGGSAWYGYVNGVLVTKAAATDMAALSGTVTNAKFNVFCFFVDSGGTLSSVMGTEGASLATIQFPTRPANKTLIGFVIINPTGTGNFVGGTTALDDATVVPNAVYVNSIGPWDSTFKMS